MVYPTSPKDTPQCVAIGNHVTHRDNLAHGPADLARIFGPSLPMSPDEYNLLQSPSEKKAIRFIVIPAKAGIQF